MGFLHRLMMALAGERVRDGRHRAAALCLVFAVVGSPGWGREAAGRTAMLIVVGVGGSAEHRERFTGWARELCAAAISRPRPLEVRLLVERPAEASGEEGPCVPSGRSTRDEVEQQIRSAAAAAGAGQGFFLVMLGHGSGGRDPRFQLPGPDLAPAELARMLDGVSSGPVTVAHLGSASGAFVPALSAPGRVVLTAARAHETNETRFAKHFIAAFSGDDSDGGADRNKDGRLSALEVFRFARLGVEREYERAGLLRTEHPLLDDNGDGVGSPDPEAAPGSDGALAARRHLVFRTRDAAAAADLAAANPELAALIAERDALAARVDALREVRESMEEAAYLAELEALLLRIAGIAERIAALRGEAR